MKIYISADIEGVAGINAWDETDAGKSEDYAPFRRQMTREVAAAIEGARKAGATHITVRDAHDSARNLIPEELPRGITLIRGWSGHPVSMMEGLDETYDAVFMIGYHSPGGSNGNPLSHTMSIRIAGIDLNGKRVSEFALNARYAASLGVRVSLVTGDENLMQEVNNYHPDILTVASGKGVGKSTYARHPLDMCDAIEAEAEKALSLRHSCEEGGPFTLEIHYAQHTQAYRAGFYPGAAQTSETSVRIQAENILDVHRALDFML